MPDFTHSSVLVHGICIPSLAHQEASAHFLCRFSHHRCTEFQERISKFRHNFLETQPFWETGSILESLHHALPIKTNILNFEWVGGRGCEKNSFGAMIYVWDRPGHPLSQIFKIFFCSPSSYMISQPPPKNKVIRWRSGLGVNTTTQEFSVASTFSDRSLNTAHRSSVQSAHFQIAH